ncbi:MAG: hypothetical protein L6416_03455 [Candidatus Omnitrophica bacterium]|nr:hypothetical protein [Candidatus Omnitrophota bacterium]
MLDIKKLVILTIVFCVALSDVNAFSEQITIHIHKPKKSTDKVASLNPLKKAETAGGIITLDISPYPTDFELDRYSVKYYINGELLYSTTGINDNNPEVLSFKYELDTRLYGNDNYKIDVNYFDSKQGPAIGGRIIIIKNTSGN